MIWTLRGLIIYWGLCLGGDVTRLGDWPKGAEFLKFIAYFSNAAYGQQSTILRPPGLDTGYPLNIMASQDRSCMILSLKSHSEMILVFPGSKNKGDWITDLKVKQVPFSSDINTGLVHYGFLNYYNSLRDQTIQVLLKQSRLKTLIVAGHSLGGAVATIACSEIAYLFPSIKVVCITFGSPRVGNVQFVNWYRRNVKQTFRFVMEHDPVPNVPNSRKYVHVAPGICMTLVDTMSLIPDNVLANRWDRFVTVTSKIVHLMKEHVMKTYMDRIERWNNCAPTYNPVFVSLV